MNNAVAMIGVVFLLMSSDDVPDYPPDMPVACVADVTIRFNAVGPDPRMLDAEERHRWTQTLLNEKVGELLIDFAFRRYALIATEEEIRSAIPPSMADETNIRAIEQMSHRMVAAVRRVQQGENARAVYDDLLSPAATAGTDMARVRTPLGTLTYMADTLRNEQVIESYLRKSSVEATRQRYREFAARKVKLRKLRALIRERGERESDFWKRMMTESHAEVFLPGFELPRIKEEAEP